MDSWRRRGHLVRTFNRKVQTMFDDNVAVEPGAYSLAAGARGFLVERLQERLGVTADGAYGPGTAAAVKALQAKHNLEQTGRAGPREFDAAGLAWPGAFERCMNLVSVFEGTGFGDCNATDIDGAGLTIGVAGFTTAHGEVQRLLREYLRRRPTAKSALDADTALCVDHLLSSGGAAHQWKRLFFGNNKRVTSQWCRVLERWGRDSIMQQLQLRLAREQFWLPAHIQADRLHIYSVQGMALLLDVGVQNGGWRREHLEEAERMGLGRAADEAERRMIMAQAVAQCAAARWRQDVLQRKVTIAAGSGRVHGREVNLQSYGIVPAFARVGAASGG